MPNRHQRRAAKTSSFAEAVALHQAGRLDEAEASYRRMISARADNIEAIANLGLLLHQRGQIDEAIVCHRRAIAAKPDFANAYMNLVMSLEATGRFAEAVQAYRRLLLLVPEVPEIWNNLGVALQQLGRREEAIAHHRTAIEIKPDFHNCYYNLSLAQRALNRLEEAADALRRAVALNPASASYHTALGVTLGDLGAWEEAVDCHRRSIVLDPKSSATYLNLGVALDALKLWDEAVEAQRQAIALDPKAYKAYDNLGLVLRKLGRGEEAIAAHESAIAIDPAAEGPHFNLGIFLASQGRLDEAIASHRRAIANKPDFAEAHFKLGDNLLKAGQFAEGWAEYEWRWKTKVKVSNIAHHLRRPAWAGESLEGQVILVHCEQGLGDTLQFCRFARVLRRKGARVILMVDAILKSLIQGMEGVTVISLLDPIPPHDVHCPMLSVPRLLGTDLDSIPADIPYLAAQPAAVERWRSRLGPEGKRKIGLVWAGNPSHVDDISRSMPVEKLAPLLSLPDVQLFSVQKDLRAGDDAWVAASGGSVTMLGPELTDFAETAAALTALDLLLTVDTSVCHLAGAMGRPTWLLLPFAAEWRWMTERLDSPWYPTMRLFRQNAPRDWDELMSRVAGELSSSAAPRDI